MLGATGRALDWTGESAGDPLCDILTECQSRVQQHLSKFLNEKLNNAEKSDGGGGGGGRGTMAEAFGRFWQIVILLLFSPRHRMPYNSRNEGSNCVG
jgi:hypothetical protein